jgi:hypothetical protein
MASDAGGSDAATPTASPSVNPISDVAASGSVALRGSVPEATSASGARVTLDSAASSGRMLASRDLTNSSSEATVRGSVRDTSNGATSVAKSGLPSAISSRDALKVRPVVSPRAASDRAILDDELSDAANSVDSSGFISVST